MEVCSFCTFWDIHFRSINPKNFLKAPMAPTYNNFESKKTQFFFNNIFPKTVFLVCLSKNLQRRKFFQNRNLFSFTRAQKIYSVDLKQLSGFLPLEKIVDPSLNTIYRSCKIWCQFQSTFESVSLQSVVVKVMQCFFVRFSS